jgi:3-hydroxyisobutyrate dehydrogenase-like beta-hydroxyacid dehydrogenase
LFSHFKPGASIDVRGKWMAEGTFKPPAFELKMARKDVRLMLETAAAGDAALHFLPAIAARIDELLAAGHGDEDMAVLAIDSVKS